jgi:hypothetical protein
MTKRMQETCKYCDKLLENNEFHYIYRLLVATDKQLHYIGIQKILEELADYAMNKGYHLSASEIILLRPDVVKEYLRGRIKGEKVIFYLLQESEICLECFRTEYENMVPLR